ncbi:hypothetical protein DZ860_02015 [Vibrio sinensis]|uniref:Solitary outer membrane autotransporter-like beta-barrel domain-containing protein n=1 Tax=Vibrio sinensis TaxID=2302434 RepID=A0A3A6QWY0_9VIBR|nr:hypothetical protein DZ860_02015 [Vibrio sinensis]
MYLPLIVSSFVVIPNAGKAQSNPNVQRYLEQAFSAAVVMTDSDVLTLGIQDFNPNDWFDLSDEIGSEDSIELRQQIAVTTLPYTFELSDSASPKRHQIFTRASILVSQQDYEIDDSYQDDFQREYILGGFVAYRYINKISDNWTITPGIGTHLQYFRNEHEYRSEFSNSMVKPLLDGLIFNSSAWAVSVEPHITVNYLQRKDWGSWGIESSAHYFYGFGGGSANEGEIGNPEGWYIANGISLRYNVTQWNRSLQTIYTNWRRVDLGADTTQPLGTHYYYETSIGWLMTPPFESDWIENIGIGLSFNYGSALKGGSIVLFFNQD